MGTRIGLISLVGGTIVGSGIGVPSVSDEGLPFPGSGGTGVGVPMAPAEAASVGTGVEVGISHVSVVWHLEHCPVE